mgnify:CR=1 FL=1
MQLNTVEELIEDIRHGKMVILMDDEDRENEGDLVMAAEHCTAEAINFMARFGRGLICMPRRMLACCCSGHLQNLSEPPSLASPPPPRPQPLPEGTGSPSGPTKGDPPLQP